MMEQIVKDKGLLIFRHDSMCNSAKDDSWMHGKGRFEGRCKKLMAVHDLAARHIVGFYTSIITVVYETYNSGAFVPKAGESSAIDLGDLLFTS